MGERRDKLMLKTVRDVEVRADEEALEKSLYAFRYVAVIVTIIFVLKMKENQERRDDEENGARRWKLGGKG